VHTSEDESAFISVSEPSPGTASLKSSAINLIKNCVGAGVFSLNSRVSSITANPADLVYVGGLVGFMALWAAYNFYIVGETCKLTESETLGEVSFTYYNCFDILLKYLCRRGPKQYLHRLHG